MSVSGIVFENIKLSHFWFVNAAKAANLGCE